MVTVKKEVTEIGCKRGVATRKCPPYLGTEGLAICRNLMSFGEVIGCRVRVPACRLCRPPMYTWLLLGDSLCPPQALAHPISKAWLRHWLQKSLLWGLKIADSVQ